MDPTSEWRTLLSQDPVIGEIERLFKLLDLTPDAVLGASLTSLTDAVFRALLISEDVPLRERLLPPMLAALQRALPATPDNSAVAGLGLVRCSTLLASAGGDDDLAPGRILERWLTAALSGESPLSDRNRTSYALACAAHGLDDAVFELVGESPSPFVPGKSFGPDAHSYARYVAAAAAEGASVDDFKSAWTSFVAFFPARLETRGLRWTDLLFAGYAAYTRVAGNDPSVVLDLIREFVREMASA